MGAKLNEVSIKEAQKIVGSIISHGFLNGEAPTNICLHGSPGIGKSAIINALPVYLAPLLECKVSDIVVIDVRLAAMAESDVQGIPFVEGGKMYFSTPPWFPKDDGKYYILFFDELMNCSRPVQHAAYRIILDRSIQNGSVLPKRCAIVGAGNLRSDKTGAQPLLPAAANRFGLHLNLTRLVDSLNYMVEAGFDHSIVGYLDWQKSAIYQPPTDEAAFPSPRTWESVDKHLKNPAIADDDNILMVAVAGAVGSTHAVEYMAFREYGKILPDWKRIRSGDTTYNYKVPREDGAIQCALGTAIAYEFIDAFQRDLPKEVENLCDTIVVDLPKEVIVTMIRTLKRDPKSVAKIPRSAGLYAAFKSVAKHVV